MLRAPPRENGIFDMALFLWSLARTLKCTKVIMDVVPYNGEHMQYVCILFFKAVKWQILSKEYKE